MSIAAPGLQSAEIPHQVLGSPLIERGFHIANQLQSMSRIFGPFNTARVAIDKIRDRESEAEIQLQPQPLRHPVSIRRAYSDRWGVVEVFGERAYELPDSINRLTDGKTIVDVGAYNGVVSAYFASVHPNSPVLAIEPNPRNTDILTRNADAYSGQIAVIAAAMLPENASVVKQTFAAKTSDLMVNAYVSVSEVEASEFTPEPVVASISPDEVLDQVDGSVGILKVDIEGAERELFRSDAIDQLLANTCILLIETHDQFFPGASAAVNEAANRNGLHQDMLNNHTSLYVRS